MKNNEILLSGKPALRPQYKRSGRVDESILLARQDERERIGHELHDNVNQILTSALLYLSVLNKDCPEFEMLKNKAHDILTQGIEEIRRLSRGMVIDDLKESGLVGSIKCLIDELYATGLFNIHLVHSDLLHIEALSTPKKIAMFRIVQEQVKNIINYSKAKNIEISLHCTDLQFRMQIRDDGIGFDPATAKKGLGLSGIYERARLCNGKAHLASEPAGGCSLTVNFPLN